ncbi:unnamed protein product [Rhizoctonia solani]|uniref:Protein kinase domain-containing protein n=1 Tax=Rhizoctonia solani TaxID=456999 RepID=A0A8H3DBP2_9AGAM|nr:unnamed protein product [Rhizoctonia solani]
MALPNPNDPSQLQASGPTQTHTLAPLVDGAEDGGGWVLCKRVALRLALAVAAEHTLVADAVRAQSAPRVGWTPPCSHQTYEAPMGRWMGRCKNLKEIQSLRSIPMHPNIIPLYDCFVLPSTHELYLVFEPMEGILYQLIKTRKSKKVFPGGLVASIFQQAASALDHVHSCGYFHRDVKPENLLVTTTGLVNYPSASTLTPDAREEDLAVIIKLTDFGLAREIDSHPPYTEYVSMRWYRAPEILLRSNDYSSPTDMWSFGTVIAELLNLRPLFPGTGEMDQLKLINDILGDPSDAYGFDENGRRCGGGPWRRGYGLAKPLGYRFPLNYPTPLARCFHENTPRSLIDCIEDLLRYDPAERLTAKQCLSHRFLAETAFNS